MAKEVSEETQRLLKQVSDIFDIEDRAIRERQIRTWRRLKLYWNGFQNIWYSETAHDWRIWDAANRADDNDQSYYDKPVNIFRAYLESIIAALSVTVPSIKCFPDDAENILDLTTAKAGDKIAELVYKHNDVTLMWLHALYIYCTEGLIACYSYPKADKEYGTYEEKEYEEETITTYSCPTCGSPVDANLFTEREQNEFMPDDEDAIIHDLMINEGQILCPNCAAIIDPEIEPEHQIVSRLVGITNKPKTRQCIEVYGGLYVKVPNYAIKQADIPYLRFSYETHFSNAIDRYPNLRDKLTGQSKVAPTAMGLYDPYEAWGRLSPQYQGEYPINTVTVNNYWFRPCAFNVLNEDDAAKLKKEFPDGCKFVKINEMFADAENEALDDCWTLTHNPLSDYLHHDPLGLLLTSVQDITNDLVSLVLQTIEHGIPQTFADPDTLNFNQYNQTEALPGAIYPAKPRSGKSVGDSFHEVKTATLSGEILPFGQNIQGMGQLVSGALPSLFGGTSGQGSQTASEYAMSRAQALQRLQTPWKMLTLWWKTIFGKVIPSFIKDTMDDERIVEKDEQGNFVNVWIRKSELQGKIGSIELEASEQLPITWSQKRDTIMQLMELNNPEILRALSSPENISLLKQVIGLSDFVVPGEIDREKQYEEIQQLINSEPITIPPQIDPTTAPMNPEILQDPNAAQMMQPQEFPSVEIDPDLDNHQIEAEVCRHWLVSDAGRLAKTENPAGYKNVLLHMRAHMMIIQQALMQQQMMVDAQNPESPSSSKGATNGDRPEKPVKKAPIEENKDAQRFTVQ